MKNRVVIIDKLRGIAVIIMIAFHFLYQENLWFNDFGNLLNNFYINLVKILAQILFVAIAGICCNFSKDNIKRGLICLYLGLFIDFISYIITPKNIITFGIFSFMGTSILIYVILEERLRNIPKTYGIICFSLLFIITFLFSYKIIFPYWISKNVIFNKLIENGYLNFIGFESRSFKSSDFFPILPWIFIFFSGTFIGRKIKTLKYEKSKNRKSLLEMLGENSLIIYVVHIPVILVILKLINI